ncbi:unnamed protein product [Calypogeia fissa]
MAHHWILDMDNLLLKREVKRVKLTLQAEDKRGGPYEQLEVLPGLPNDVTFAHVTTKLSRRTIGRLPEVSRAWQKAIRSRLVYNARVASGSTETLVVINCMFWGRDPSFLAIGLYSITEQSFHRLPPIPRANFRGIPRDCQCASLDGRIYVLGGFENGSGIEPNKPSPKTYVMDLAGQGQWERCADMPFGRVGFGCGVMDGKIYVCGGRVDRGDGDFMPSCEAEVYDPKQDKWSKVRSMEESRAYFHVTAMGNELAVHCGQVYHYGDIQPYWPAMTEFPMVYNPINQEWRTIDLGPSLCDPDNKQATFVAQGRFHQMNMQKLFVFDNNTLSWRQRHKISWAGIRREIGKNANVISWTTTAVDNELVMVLTWYKFHGPFQGKEVGTDLLYSIGFGGRKKFIEWKKADIGINCFRMTKEPKLMISVVKL